MPPAPLLAAAWICGVAVERWGPLPGLQLAAAALALGLPAFLAAAPSPRLPLRRALWCLFIASMAVLRARARLPESPALGAMEGPVLVSGVIDSVPLEIQPSPYGGEAAAARLDFTLALLPSGVRIRVLVARERGEARAPLRACELVEARGTWLPPRPPAHPADRWAAGSPLLLVRSPRHVRSLGPIEPAGLRGGILRLREAIHDRIALLYEGRSRGLLWALLGGDRRLLDRDLREQLASTGTFHYLAISGLHVAVVALFIFRAPLPRGARTAGRLAMLALFALLTGSAVPVLRATLMAGLHLAAGRAGRRARPLDSLAWSAIILLAAEPEWLTDPGLQLSLAAVHAILTWGARLAPSRADPARRLLPRPVAAPSRALRAAALRWLAASAAVSTATWAATTPLVLLHFQRFHPLGPVWTILIYPIAVAILLGGLLSLAFSAVAPCLGVPWALVTALACRLLEAVLDFAHRVPGSCVHLPPPSPWIVAAASGLLLAGVLPRLRRPLLVLGCIALAATALGRAAVRRDPAVWCFDVGEASAALIATGRGETCLVDAGGRGPRAGTRLLKSILATGHAQITSLVLTHPEADHVEALPAILDSLPVGRVWMSPWFTSFPLGERVAERIRERGIPIERIERGDALVAADGSGLRIEILAPDPHAARLSPLSPNETSIALRILPRGCPGGGFWILGDVEGRGMARLLSGGDDLTADALVLPHHGHRQPLLGKLIERSRPAACIASGGGETGAREVAVELEASGRDVLATWRGGSVLSRWVDGRWQTDYWSRR